MRTLWPRVSHMRSMVVYCKRLRDDTEAQDLVEYGLLAGLITIVAFLAVTALGNAINTLLWQVISTGLASAL